MQKVIDILDEIILEANNISLEQGCSEIDYDYRQLLQKAKSRIQALGDGCELQTLKLLDECYFSNDCITWKKGTFHGYASGRYTHHHFAMKNMHLPLPPNQ